MKLLEQLPKERLQKIILTLIMSLIAVVLVTQFYVLSNWSAYQKARGEERALQAKIEDAEQQGRQLAQNKELRERVAAYLSVHRAGMIRDDPFAWVVREITLFAKDQPVTVTAVRPGGRGTLSSKTKFVTYAARIEVSGRYDELGQFVQNLENRFPTIEVRQLSLSAGAEGAPPHHATLDVVFLMDPLGDKTPEEGTQHEHTA
ncbi:MAG: type 4a pilus biogenesis protein PilO [Verrucomicrobiae bacterium]|nr:type 4a pilus biogenesis protein PilO [Verrucomicrobiae bacterium]MDW8342972.1 type 4a pilus biogenesis protein PilO [Verrucomicrobiae bacterium]